MKPATKIFFICSMTGFSLTGYTQNQWLDSVKQIAITQKKNTNKIKTLYALSDYYLLGKPDSGLYYAQQALTLSEKLQNDEKIFWSIVAINKCLYFMGNYALELSYAFKAYPLGNKLNDPNTIGWANGMMGDCYFNLGEYDSSIKYYRRVIKLAEKSKHTELYAMYGGLVPVLIKLHQYDSALIYAKKGYALFISNPGLNKGDYDTKWAKGFQYRFLAEAFAGKTYYDSSLMYYQLSLLFSKELNIGSNIVDDYNGLAKVFKETNNLDSAVWYAKKALSENVIKTYPVGLLQAANNLADIYELQHEPDSTLKYMRLAYDTNDSLFNREKTIAIQNIFFKEQEKQKDVQAAKKELQNTYAIYSLIAFLIMSVIITAIVLKNKKQAQLQNIRNSIAQDLHDDIGSTLSSISIMSELAKVKSPQALPLLSSIGENTAAIQENMSDIVWAVNPLNDQFKNVINRMNLFAAEMLEARNIELEFTSDATLTAWRFNMKQRKNLYLFFKEAINNAAKYSNAKKVCVCVSKKDRHISMNITDDGIGFDTSTVFSGNGMATLKKRAEELNAYFNIDSQMNTGTSIQLRFKIT